ncbi:MAG: sensor histidine kinase [Planctomycetota bacterium]
MYRSPWPRLRMTLPAFCLAACLCGGGRPAAAGIAVDGSTSVAPIAPALAYQTETFVAGIFLFVAGLLATVYVIRLNASLRKSLAARDEEIARRKRAEDALRQSKERYRSITHDVLDTSAVGLFILDREFKVVWVNRSLERYFGVNRDGIIGKDKRRLIAERIKFTFEDPDGFADKVLAAYDDNTYVENFECHVLAHGDREDRWLDHWSQPIRSGLHAGGRIEHYYDITDRKRAEKRLRHFEKAVESSTDAIGMATPDGRHYYQNDAFTELFGVSVEEADGETGPPSTLYADEAVGREVFDTIMGGESWIGEVEMRNREGQTIYVSLRAYPLKDANRRVIGLVGVHTNITERRRSQEVLARYAAELERSNRDLQDFTYAVSHDLQEPLRKIHTFGEFLFEDCADALPEEGREHVRRMQDATVRMKDLIQHLLRLSRVDTRGAEPAPTDPGTAVRRVTNTLSEAISDCDATVQVEPDLPRVLVDATQLEQVFQNLIGNALKFRSPDREPVVRIGAEREGKEVVFSVADNGIGIEEDYRQKIFAVFQRLHRREDYEGTGVGLALCKKIVGRHGGSIWVESTPGEGSTFRFSLRAAHPTRQEEGVAV